MVGQPFIGLRLNVYSGAAGDVVDDEGQVGGVGYFGVALHKAALGAFVVVGRYAQQRVRAHVAGLFAHLNGVVGVVGAGSGYYRHAAGGLFHREADGSDVLLVG